MTAVKVVGANKFSVLGNYIIKRGVRTIAIDPESGTLYISTADFDTGELVNGRPKIIPGSFQVLVTK